MYEMDVFKGRQLKEYINTQEWMIEKNGMENKEVRISNELEVF